MDFTKVRLTEKTIILTHSVEDKKHGNIVDMVVLPNCNILVADGLNQSLKIIEARTGQMLTHVRLSDVPNSLCLLPGDRVALTSLPMKEIQIFDVSDDQLKLLNVVNVKGHCCGLAYMNDIFVVGFREPGRVAIISFEGNDVKSVSKDNTGKRLFSFPRFICVDTEKTVPFIYVSDASVKTISRLNENLDVLQTIESPTPYAPYGLAPAGGGQVLLREWYMDGKARLCLLDTNTMVPTVLLEEKDWGRALLITGRVVICPRLGRVYCNSGMLVKKDLEFIVVYEIS